MPIPIHVVDAFASDPFTGNPAGVVVTDAPLPDALMRSIAAEMKHAETAFAVPRGERFGLRWMTPEAEVDLCGHATLATAHVLWETRRVTASAIEFETRSGVLVARRDAAHGIELDFPALTTRAPDEEVDLGAALGVPVVETHASRFDRLVVTRSEGDVRGARPDFAALKRLPVRGVILTARGEGENDFVSRFFAPAVGVDEDPVTGSAHCALAPFWGARLHKTEMRGAQIGPRGGIVGVALAGDRVKLRGRARTVLRGELLVDG